MAEAKRPAPVKLIIGMIFAREDVLARAKTRLARKFGSLDFESEVLPFDYTDYYAREMGPGLKRQFISFKKLISPGRLPDIKGYTNRLERSLGKAKGGSGRSINLDPGYIAASKLILATCKDYSHRIYLDKGIFAEATLDFRDGTFRPHPWTYPDYRSAEYIRILNAIRELYLRQLF